MRKSFLPSNCCPKFTQRKANEGTATYTLTCTKSQLEMTKEQRCIQNQRPSKNETRETYGELYWGVTRCAHPEARKKERTREWLLYSYSLEIEN